MSHGDTTGSQGNHETAFELGAAPANLLANADIREIYKAVMRERPDDIEAAGDGWVMYMQQMYTTKTALIRHLQTLEKHWQSDAATVLINLGEETVSCLSEWETAAACNYPALHGLAIAIPPLQHRMTELWNEFQQKARAAIAEDHHSWSRKHPLEWAHDLYEINSGYNSRADPVVDLYTQRAINEVLNPLNQAYKDAYVAMYPGKPFAGPTNAQIPTPRQMAAAVGLPGAPPAPPPPPAPAPPPGGSPPPPTPPPTPPALTPGLWAIGPESVPPPIPLPPGAPGGLPPAPPPLPSGVPGGLPPAPPPLPSGVSGSPPAPPGFPGAVPPRPVLGPAAMGTAPPPFGSRPGGAPPSMSRPPAAPRTLQGRGLPTSELPPSSALRPPPPLSGRPSSPNNPMARPPRPGMSNDEPPDLPPASRGLPNLPGRSGNKSGHLDEADALRSRLQGEQPLSPGRFGTPSNLQGIRDPRPVARAGSLESEEAPLERLPTLTSRLASAADTGEAELESAAQAMRQGLVGRGGLPADSRREEDRANDRRVAARSDERLGRSGQPPASVDFVGDSGLFLADETAPAVIERPPQPQAATSDDPAVRLAAQSS